MKPPIWTFPLRLPRSGFSPRNMARAGALWRFFQEAAVEGSTRAGWPPERYRDEGAVFIVRSMAVRHYREIAYGTPTQAKTWVSRNRRETFSTRQVRLLDQAGTAVAGTQEWVFVTEDMQICRGPTSLWEALPTHESGDTSVQICSYDPMPSTTHSYSISCWHTWMDPLNHVNHPAFVDFCDEALAQLVACKGLNPALLRPVFETVIYRKSIPAGANIVVHSQRLGITPSRDVVVGHQLTNCENGQVFADATTIRRLVGDSQEPLVDAFEALGNV